MSKKWYNLFVSVDQSAEAAGEEASPAAKGRAGPAPSPAETVAQIASTLAAEPTFTGPVANPTSFEEIYRAAEITAPPHGYTIQKVAEMLASEHIRDLPAQVKQKSVMVALDAAGVKMREIIEDAVRRDRALDTYERLQEKGLLELEARKTQENQRIQAEIDRLVAERRARMQANSDEVAKEKERFYGWRLKKQEEEQKIADAVSYFVEENPITTGSPAAAAPPPPKPKAP
jgi:hypothetical protein